MLCYHETRTVSMAVRSSQTQASDERLDTHSLQAQRRGGMCAVLPTPPPSPPPPHTQPPYHPKGGRIGIRPKSKLVLDVKSFESGGHRVGEVCTCSVVVYVASGTVCSVRGTCDLHDNSVSDCSCNSVANDVQHAAHFVRGSSFSMRGDLN